MRINTNDSYADIFAFLGNSLLKPMAQTETIGLTPTFWDNFPDFDNQEIRSVLLRCRQYAEQAQSEIANGKDMVEEVSVEYTKLFIGPPSPAAPPWETMNRNGGASVGFGEPTFQMQEVLRDLGLEMNNSNNQYVDHMGIELLALSEMLRRIHDDVDSQGSQGSQDPQNPQDGDTSKRDILQNAYGSQEKVAEFIKTHLLSWIAEFQEKIHAKTPDGYYDNLVQLTHVLLESAYSCLVSS